MEIIKDFLQSGQLLSTQETKIRVFLGTPPEAEEQYHWIIWVHQLVQVFKDRNICTEFEEELWTLERPFITCLHGYTIYNVLKNY